MGGGGEWRQGEGSLGKGSPALQTLWERPKGTSVRSGGLGALGLGHGGEDCKEKGAGELGPPTQEHGDLGGGGSPTRENGDLGGGRPPTRENSDLGAGGPLTREHSDLGGGGPPTQGYDDLGEGGGAGGPGRQGELGGLTRGWGRWRGAGCGA